MNKKCFYIFLLVLCEAHCCRNDYLKCLNDFIQSFFVSNATDIEHVNASNIPENFKQVKDVDIGGIEQTLREISGFIEDELTKKLNIQGNAVIVNDPKTRIYVKTFTYGDEEDFLSNLEKSSTVIPFEQINLDDKEDNPVTTISWTSIDTSKNENIEKTHDKDKQGIKTENASSTPKLATQGEQKTLNDKNLRKNDLEHVKNSNYKNTDKTLNNNKTALDKKETYDKNGHKEKDFEKKHIKENIIQTDYDVEYNIEDATDYPAIDYIDLYKDTTNEENEYKPTDAPKLDEIEENVEAYSLEIETEDFANDNFTNICQGNTSAVSTVFPWIATIFIKNDTNQYQYICDGAILSDKLLITAARCVNFFNTTVTPDDVLVFLGKRSLQVVGDDEKNVRISRIIIHDGFRNDETVANDLALLVLEEPIAFTDGIRPACVGDIDLDNAVKSTTTAWDLKGDLIPVFLEKTNDGDCIEKSEGTFCATYGNEVALCPSYGGIFASKRGPRWVLHALRSGDTSDRGLCFTKNVRFTPLAEFRDWIMKYIE